MKQVFDVDAWQQVIVSSLSRLGETLASFLPNLVGTLVIVFVGWVISRIVGSISSRVLHRLRLDDAAERLGVSEVLRSTGLHTVPSRILGRLVFWVLMLTFLLSGAEALGLSAVTATIDRLIQYLPNVIAAALIVVVGLLLARFARTVVSSAAATARLDYARPLGAAAHGALVTMTGVLTLEQLGVNTQLLITLITVVAASGGLALCFAFAVGSRDVVRGILASHYLRQSLEEGEEIEVAGRRGTVERIGPVDTRFRGAEAGFSVPNVELLRQVIIHAE